VYTYLSASIAIFLGSIIVQFFIAVYSMKGTMTDAEPRQPLVKFLTIQLFFWGFQFISASSGIVIILEFNYICSTESFMVIVQGLIILLIVSQLTDLTVTSCCCLLFRGRRIEDDNSLPVFDERRESLVQMEWDSRCQRWCRCATCLTCGIFGQAGDGSEDFSMIARVMANVFNAEGRLDLVMSDVLAGIILLRHVQRRQDQLKRVDFSFNRENKTSGNLLEEPITPSKTNSLLRHKPMLSLQREPGYQKGATVGSADSSTLHSRYYRIANENVLSPQKNPAERKLLEEISHYSRYMLGIYSWPLFVYMNPTCGLCRLCWIGCCHIHPRRRRLSVEDTGLMDSCTQWGSTGAVRGDKSCLKANESALLSIAGLKECDLAYANFANDVHQTPYCIAVDHSRHTVVIAIRGTLSLEDCIVDALAEPASLEETGNKWGFDGSGEYCHSGMLLRARWVREDIEKTQVLHMLLQRNGHSGAQSAGGNSAHRRTLSEPLVQDCQGYELKVLGHSLGAACATLCSLMLQREYPNLTCLAYSPPGGLLSSGIAERCKSFVHSVILGSEIVPRMSFHSLEKMRGDILNLIGRCKVSKAHVTKSILDTDADPEDLLHPEHLTPQTEYHRQLEQYQAQHEAEAARNPLLRSVTLYPPGNLVHFVKTEKWRQRTAPCCCKTVHEYYTPIWTSADCLQEIQVSKTMMVDHFPDRLMNIITQNVERLLHQELDHEDEMISRPETV